VANLSEVFTVREDRGDGLDLRWLRYGGEDVLARVYFAVRDVWWRTVPLSIVARRRTVTPGGFVVEADATADWESHPVAVTLRYVADGPVLTAECTATALGSFAYGRLGFCLLFGPDAARGRPATSWRRDRETAFEFPAAIVTRDDLGPAAVRFHRRFDRLEVTAGSGRRVCYAFEGDEFEFEDQRNWTDASFKAYSSPPPGGPPAATSAGRTFRQRIRIAVEPGPAPTPTTAADNGAADAIVLGDPVGTVPRIGLYEGRLSPRSYRPAGGFYELNAHGLAAARQGRHDSIELAVNGAVHAADDDSVQETTALHGVVVAQARAAYPDLPVRLAPVTFLDAPGDWRDAAGRYSPEPPAGPLPPRLLGPFAATWAIASAARALPAGVDAVAYFDAALPADAPAARTVARLAALCGRPIRAVRAPAALAVLAVDADAPAVTLAVANPGPDPVRFRLPDGRPAALAGFASDWYEVTAVDPDPSAQDLRVTSRDSASS
jgi:hypothetical protein